MGKRKSTTKSSESSSTVTTPTNPDWVAHTAQSLNTGIQRIGGMDPYSLVAPVSDLERQASAGAAKLGQGFGDAAGGVGSDRWFSDLLSQPASSVGAASLLDNFDAYQNPYRTQVTDAAMADFDADAGRTRAAQDLTLAGQSAFGGSGAALSRSLTEGELARARNSQYSKLLSDLFTTSAGLASQDADRRQQAALANAQMEMQDRQARAQLALDRDSAARANAGAQATVGAQLREADQAMRSAPLTQLKNQLEMFSGLPLQLFHGQNVNSTGTSTSKTTQTPSILDQIGQVADIANTIASSSKLSKLFGG